MTFDSTPSSTGVIARVEEVLRLVLDRSVRQRTGHDDRQRQLQAGRRRLGWSSVEFDFRWGVKPGLTGLAQLVGARCTNDALELDRAYNARWSPPLDCQLIALSFAVNLLGKRRVEQMLRRSKIALEEPIGIRGNS